MTSKRRKDLDDKNKLKIEPKQFVCLKSIETKELSCISIELLKKIVSPNMSDTLVIKRGESVLISYKGKGEDLQNIMETGTRDQCEEAKARLKEEQSSKFIPEPSEISVKSNDDSESESEEEKKEKKKKVIKKKNSPQDVINDEMLRGEALSIIVPGKQDMPKNQENLIAILTEIKDEQKQILCEVRQLKNVVLDKLKQSSKNKSGTQELPTAGSSKQPSFERKEVFKDRSGHSSPTTCLMDVPDDKDKAQKLVDDKKFDMEHRLMLGAKSPMDVGRAAVEILYSSKEIKECLCPPIGRQTTKRELSPARMQVVKAALVLRFDAARITKKWADIKKSIDQRGRDASKRERQQAHPRNYEGPLNHSPDRNRQNVQQLRISPRKIQASSLKPVEPQGTPRKYAKVAVVVDSDSSSYQE